MDDSLPSSVMSRDRSPVRSSLTVGSSDFSVPRRSNSLPQKSLVRVPEPGASNTSGAPCSMMILPLFHEQDVRSEGAGEIHLVRGHDHGHAAVREVTDNREHFADKLGVEGGGRLVEEHDLGVHGAGGAMATCPLSCPPESWAG